MRTVPNWRLILVLCAALAATAGGLYLGNPPFFSPARFSTTKAVPEEFWEAALPDLDGQLVRLADFRNTLIVVNFWAPWCPPCVEEIPDLIELQREFSPKGVQFLGIAFDSAENVALFQKKIQLNYRSLIAQTNAHITRYLRKPETALTVPFTAIIAPNGHILLQKHGKINKEQLRTLLLKAAKNPAETKA